MTPEHRAAIEVAATLQFGPPHWPRIQNCPHCVFVGHAALYGTSTTDRYLCRADPAVPTLTVRVDATDNAHWGTHITELWALYRTRPDLYATPNATALFEFLHDTHLLPSNPNSE